LQAFADAFAFRREFAFLDRRGPASARTVAVADRHASPVLGFTPFNAAAHSAAPQNTAPVVASATSGPDPVRWRSPPALSLDRFESRQWDRICAQVCFSARPTDRRDERAGFLERLGVSFPAVAACGSHSREPVRVCTNFTVRSLPSSWRRLAAMGALTHRHPRFRSAWKAAAQRGRTLARMVALYSVESVLYDLGDPPIQTHSTAASIFHQVPGLHKRILRVPRVVSAPPPPILSRSV